MTAIGVLLDEIPLGAQERPQGDRVGLPVAVVVGRLNGDRVRLIIAQNAGLGAWMDGLDARMDGLEVRLDEPTGIARGGYSLDDASYDGFRIDNDSIA